MDILLGGGIIQVIGGGNSFFLSRDRIYRKESVQITSEDIEFSHREPHL